MARLSVADRQRKERFDALSRGLGKFLDSGLPQEMIRSAGNVLTSVAQASATNPLAASGTMMLLASGARRVRWVSEAERNLIYGASLGYLGVQSTGAVAGALADVIGAFTGTERASSQAVNISFDVPDNGPSDLRPRPQILDIEPRQIDGGSPLLLGASSAIGGAAGGAAGAAAGGAGSARAGASPGVFIPGTTVASVTPAVIALQEPIRRAKRQSKAKAGRGAGPL